MCFNELVMILFQKNCGGFSIKQMNMYMVCKLINLMKPLGGYTLLHLYICLHDYDYVMNFFLFYGDIT